MIANDERPVTPPSATPIASRKKREKNPKAFSLYQTDDASVMMSTPSSRGTTRPTVKRSPLKRSSRISRHAVRREIECNEGNSFHLPSYNHSSSTHGGFHLLSRSTTAGTTSSAVTPYILYKNSPGSGNNLNPNFPPEFKDNQQHSNKGKFISQIQSGNIVDRDFIDLIKSSPITCHHQKSEERQQFGPTSQNSPLPYKLVSINCTNIPSSSSIPIAPGSSLLTPICMGGKRRREPRSSNPSSCHQFYEMTNDEPENYPLEDGHSHKIDGRHFAATWKHKDSSNVEPIIREHQYNNINQRFHSTKRYRKAKSKDFTNRTRTDGIAKDTVINTLTELLLKMDGFQFMGEDPSEKQMRRNVVGERVEGLRRTQKRVHRSESRMDSCKYRRKRLDSGGSWSSAVSDPSVSMCEEPHYDYVECNVDRDSSSCNGNAWEKTTSKRRLDELSFPRYPVDDHQSIFSQGNQNHVDVPRFSTMYSPRHNKGDLRLRREIILLRRHVSKLQNDIERLRKREAMTESALDKVLDVLAHVTRQEVSSSVFASLTDKLIELPSLPLTTKHLVAQLLNGLAMLDAALHPHHARKGFPLPDSSSNATLEASSRFNVQNKALEAAGLTSDVPYDSALGDPTMSATFDSSLMHRKHERFRQQNKTIPKFLETDRIPAPSMIETYNDQMDMRSDNRFGKTSLCATRNSSIPSNRRPSNGNQSSDADVSSFAGQVQRRYLSVEPFVVNISLSSCRHVLAGLQAESQLQTGKIFSTNISMSELSDHPSRIQTTLDSHYEMDPLAINYTGYTLDHSPPTFDQLRLYSSELLTPQTLPQKTISSNRQSTSSKSSGPRGGDSKHHASTSTASPHSLAFPDEGGDSENGDCLRGSTIVQVPLSTEKQSRPWIVPLLGLRGVGSGSWMSGQQTSGETYASYGLSGASTISNALDSDPSIKDGSYREAPPTVDQLQNCVIGPSP